MTAVKSHMIWLIKDYLGVELIDIPGKDFRTMKIGPIALTNVRSFNKENSLYSIMRNYFETQFAEEFIRLYVKMLPKFEGEGTCVVSKAVYGAVYSDMSAQKLKNTHVSFPSDCLPSFTLNKRLVFVTRDAEIKSSRMMKPMKIVRSPLYALDKEELETMADMPIADDEKLIGAAIRYKIEEIDEDDVQQINA